MHGLSLSTEEVVEPTKHREIDLHIADWFERAIDWLLYSEDSISSTNLECGKKD